MLEPVSASSHEVKIPVDFSFGVAVGGDDRAREMDVFSEHNYSYVFDFEKSWNEPSFWKYMLERWTDSFIYAVLYVFVVFGGQMYMRQRPKFDLRLYLVLWSGTLAAFSILGAIRTIPELISAWKNRGLQYTVCVPTYFKGPTAFWSFMFTVSKVYELGDTVFIVLRKQQLIFLHWYHHVTVLIYVWYSYTDHTAPGRWFMVMNFTVHAVMYTYYTLRAIRIYVPKAVSMLITSLQLLQMVIGVSINIWIYQIKNSNQYCHQTYENLRYSSMMYFSYFVLFAHFFYSAYVDGRLKAKKEA